MINEEWPLRPLGELFEIGAGKTMSAAARSGVDKTPFLRTSNVFWDEIDLSTVDEMAIPAHELQGKLLTPGDLLVCEGGDIGRAAIWTGEVETMSFQNHLHRLRPIADDVEPRFYVYFLQSGFTQLGIFDGAGNKTTIPNLSRNRLAALDVPHPGIDEQRHIARALTHVRAAMKLHDQSLAVSQDLKLATMATLFTRGLKGEVQKETDIGLVPESWEVKKLGDLFQTKHGFAFDGKYFQSSGEYILLTPGHFLEEGGFRDQFEKTKFYTGPVSQEYLLKPGSLLIAMTEQKAGLLGSTIIIPETGKYLHNQRLGLITALKPTLIQKFLYHVFSTEGVRSEIARTATGSKVKHTSPGRIADLIIGLPSLSEQQEIVVILDAIDRKINLHKQKRAVLDELFKSLLHKLMTGEVRVTDLDLSVLGLTPLQGVAA
jgi:type I restriction enzyme, S subunit